MTPGAALRAVHARWRRCSRKACGGGRDRRHDSAASVTFWIASCCGVPHMMDSHSERFEITAANGPRLLLADHHRELEEMCNALLASAYEDCARSLTEQYRVFERAVLEHLEAEDMLLLPGYGLHAPDDAHAIGEEHAAIRRLLFLLGIEVELHLVRLETLRSLIATLHAHAAREDRTLYPWAQAHLPLSAKRRLFVRIGRSLRALAERRSR